MIVFRQKKITFFYEEWTTIWLIFQSPYSRVFMFISTMRPLSKAVNALWLNTREHNVCCTNLPVAHMTCDQ
jgi:hypothetical protein